MGFFDSLGSGISNAVQGLGNAIGTVINSTTGVLGTALGGAVQLINSPGFGALAGGVGAALTGNPQLAQMGAQISQQMYQQQANAANVKTAANQPSSGSSFFDGLFDFSRWTWNKLLLIAPLLILLIWFFSRKNATRRYR